MSSTRFAWPSTACPRANSTVLAISRCAFDKMSLESDPYFLYRRNTVPVLDILLEISSLIDDVVDLQDFLKARIWKLFHVTIFKRILDFVENIVTRGDQVIVHFGHFLSEVVHLDQ